MGGGRRGPGLGRRWRASSGARKFKFDFVFPRWTWITYDLPTHHLSSLEAGLVSDVEEDLLLFDDIDYHRRGGFGSGASPAVYYGEGTDALDAVREHNFAVHLRHSRVYFCFNILMVGLTTFLVAYVVCSQDHTPRSSLFFALEFIVTAAVIVDLAVEVSYFGAQDYFLRTKAPHANADSRGVDSIGELVLRCSLGTGSIIRCMSHWFQLGTIVCHSIDCIRCCPGYSSYGSAFHRTQDHSQDGWREVKVSDQTTPTILTAADKDNLVSLFLLLLRYLVYVIFLVTSSSRSMHVQGCFDETVEWEVADTSDRESGWWD